MPPRKPLFSQRHSIRAAQMPRPIPRCRCPLPQPCHSSPARTRTSDRSAYRYSTHNIPNHGKDRNPSHTLRHPPDRSNELSAQQNVCTTGRGWWRRGPSKHIHHSTSRFQWARSQPERLSRSPCTTKKMSAESYPPRRQLSQSPPKVRKEEIPNRNHPKTYLLYHHMTPGWKTSLISYQNFSKSLMQCLIFTAFIWISTTQAG